MIKKSQCCNAEWRFPVTADPTGEGRVICRGCEKYTTLEPQYEMKPMCNCAEIEGQDCSNCNKFIRVFSS